MTDVATIAEIGTAVGTLVLGAATFASVRTSNRAARVAERSLSLRLRPVLIPSRPEDPDQKILFGDGRKFVVPAAGALVEEHDDAVYLVIPLRNVGAGMAVLQRYDVITDNPLHETQMPLEQSLHRRERRYRDVEHFRTQQRDLYIAPGDIGFWQAGLRDPDDELHREVSATIGDEAEALSIDLLYGDHEGGQHQISRFSLVPHGDGKWMCTVVYHWIVDGVDPRDLR